MTVVQPAVRGGAVSNPDYRNPFGARVATQNYSGVGTYVYVGAPGYGVIRGVVPTIPSTAPCETQFTGGGGEGDMSARQSLAEGEAAKLPRTMFSISDARALVKAGQLELYDAAGRKARKPSSGIYFVLERNSAGVVTARRTVVVTP